jgi:hypothetical protein
MGYRWFAQGLLEPCLLVHAPHLSSKHHRTSGQGAAASSRRDEKAGGSPFQQRQLTGTGDHTVTAFSTVGFGDITAASQPARLVVTVQMLLDLLVLGLGIRVIIGAVQRARQQAPPATDPDMPPEQRQHHNNG